VRYAFDFECNTVRHSTYVAVIANSMRVPTGSESFLDGIDFKARDWWLGGTCPHEHLRRRKVEHEPFKGFCILVKKSCVDCKDDS
jgi:hypothetical protein